MAEVSKLSTRLNNLKARADAIYGDPSTPSSTTGYGMNSRTGTKAALQLFAKNFNAATGVNYTSNQITLASHSMQNGDYVEYDANGNDPIVGNLIEDAHYYVRSINANTVELYYEYDQDTGTFSRIVDLLSGSTGTHILNHLQGDISRQSDYFNLYLDIASCRVHQIGASYNVPNSATIQVGDKSFEQYIIDLEDLMTLVESEYGILDPNQFSLGNLRDGTNTNITSTRTSAWNGTITHEFQLNFPDAGSRTGYFNAGGDVRMFQNLTGGSGSKTADWRNILNNAGTIIFSASGTSRLNQGPGGSVTASITPYNLTTSYQTIFTISGASYAANRMDVQVKTSGAALVFRVRFRDLDTGGSGLPGGTFGPDPVDENVNGTISNTVTVNRPNGSFTVGGDAYDTVNYSYLTGLTTINL